MKNRIIIFLSAFILELAITPCRAITLTEHLSGFNLALLVGFISFFILTCIILKKFSEKIRPCILLMLILGGTLIIYLPIIIHDFQSTLISLPEYSFHILGILLAFIIFNKRIIIKISVTLLGLLLVFYFIRAGYDHWINYLNYGKFTEETNEYIDTNLISFIDENGNEVKLNSIPQSYVILSFWNTTCGWCIEKIPQINKLFDRISHNPDMALYGVCVCYRDNDSDRATAILEKHKADYPNLTMKGNKEILSKLNVSVYPTVLIVNIKTQRILYRGNTNNIDSFINKLPE